MLPISSFAHSSTPSGGKAVAVIQRAVLLRAVAAAVVLAVACGTEHAVGHALARRGAELAAHQHRGPAHHAPAPLVQQPRH
jgi:hypothetical protein